MTDKLLPSELPPSEPPPVPPKAAGPLLDAFAGLGGRKFFAGTVLACAILAAGFLGKIPMLDAIQWAVLVYGGFAGADVINTVATAKLPPRDGGPK